MNRFGPLYEIDHLEILLGFVLAPVIGVVVRGVLQARVAALLGDGFAVSQGRSTLDPRKHVEVYSIVAWALGGFAWGNPALFGWRASKRARIVTCLTGPVVLLALTVGWVAVLRGVGADGNSHLILFLNYGAAVTAGMTVLACVPVPPLDGWPVLRAVAKPTLGLEKARYQLEDNNIGLFVALGLVALPRLFTSLPDPVYSLAKHVFNLAVDITGG